MIRLIIELIVIVFDFILAVPIFLIAHLVGLVSKKGRDRIAKATVDVYFTVLTFLTGAKVVYKGLDNIPKDRAVLYVGNHSSFFDVIMTYPKLVGNAGYISKKEFEKVPILAQVMKTLYCLFIDRNNIKDGLKTILKAIEYIKNGISIFIFPEGTRSKNGVMAEFKEGSMKIATKTGCPIIPVAFSNTAEVFENHMPKIKAVPVIIEFGAPIYPEDFDKDEQKHLGKKLHDIIEEMRDNNYKEIEEISKKS